MPLASVGSRLRFADIPRTDTAWGAPALDRDQALRLLSQLEAALLELRKATTDDR